MARASALVACLALTGCVAAQPEAQSCASETLNIALAAQCAGAAQAYYSFAAAKAAPTALQMRLKARADALTETARACRAPGKSLPDRGLITGFPTQAELNQERAIRRSRDETLAFLRQRYDWLNLGEVPIEAFGPEPAGCESLPTGG